MHFDEHTEISKYYYTHTIIHFILYIDININLHIHNDIDIDMPYTMSVAPVVQLAI